MIVWRFSEFCMEVETFSDFSTHRIVNRVGGGIGPAYRTTRHAGTSFAKATADTAAPGGSERYRTVVG